MSRSSKKPPYVDPKLLKKATAKGLDAATGALPGSGSVRAIGDAGAEEGGLRVRVELRIEGVGADAEWARRAEAAFAAAVLAALAKKGVAARHVG